MVSVNRIILFLTKQLAPVGLVATGLWLFAGCYGQPDDPAVVALAIAEDHALQPAPDERPSQKAIEQSVPAEPSRIRPASIEFEIDDFSGPQPVPGVQLAVLEENVDTDTTIGGGSTAADVLGNWKQPKFALFVTGRQHGYIEPCGCTGLENAKGGLSRRYTLLSQLRERGWKVIPVDVGNQVRRFGKQAEIKFQRTADILNMMNYDAVGLGPDDLRMSLDGLLAPLSEGRFVCANVDVFQLNATYRVVDAGGTQVGITGVLGLGEQKKINRGTEIGISDPVSALQAAIPKLRSEGAQFNVLLAHASLEETRQLVQKFPNVFDVVVTAGGAGEPTREPEQVPGSKSQIIQVGTKGMYVGVVGIYESSPRPLRYERVDLDARFADSKKVLEIFADYQKQLEIQGLAGLGVRPVKHSTGQTYVGYERCGGCHTTALEVFESTPHHHATQSLVKPPNSRGDIPRHFDPECLSCHVTGWNPQEHFPYLSGYMDLSQEHVHASGCENCHGPGSAHVAAEEGDVDLSEPEIEKLRAAMRLTLEDAKKTQCYQCHDLDNSPEFDFDSYWEKIEHYGVD